MTARILIGDVRAALRTLPADSVHCVVTSPPYWGLRTYLPDDHPAKGDELGLEATPDEYIGKMVEVFREVRRVLRPDGTLWLNIGDSYCTSPRGNRPGDYSTSSLTNPGRQDSVPRPNRSTLDSPEWQEEKPRPTTRTARDMRHTPKPSASADGPTHDPKWPGARDRQPGRPNRSLDYGLKHKDMVGIPWMLAFALRADGWWLRMDIIWHKPNPMPESVTDRPTKSHEYLFLLTKSERYFYDAAAIREQASYGDHPRNGTPDLEDIQSPGQPKQAGLTKLRRNGNKGGPPVGYSMAGGGRGPTAGNRAYTKRADAGRRDDDFDARWDERAGQGEIDPGTRNSRSVWTIATHPFPEAHFATFPPDLAERCILAGTSAMGCCPFCAAPMERAVDRDFVPQDDVSPDLGVRGAGEQKPMDDSNSGKASRAGTTSVTTAGWQPTCDCPEPPAGATRPGCTVLDPFNGAGTAGLVALRLQRSYLGIDLYDQYAQMSVRRIIADAPLLNRVALVAVAE